MKNYLQSKGFEFQDERLNTCINLAASSIFGRRKINWLLKHLTCESVEVINTKKFVTNIPGKNGTKIECGIVPQENDPACVDTIMEITVIKPNGVYCGFEFHLAKFHKNMHECEDSFFEYIETRKTENGMEFLMKHDLSMSVLSMLDSSLFKPQGIYTNINDNYTFPIIKPMNAEKLFRKIGANLQTREEYIKQDVETLKKVHPKMCEFFQTNWNKRQAYDKVASLKFMDEEFEKVFDEVLDGDNSTTEPTHGFKEKLIHTLLSIKSRATDICFRSALEKGLDKRMYREWIRENNLQDTEAMEYAEWVVENTGISKNETQTVVSKNDVASNSNVQKISDYLNYAKQENDPTIDD